MKKSEISVLNVLFCLMVIFIHVTAAPITGHNTTEEVSRILYFIQRMCGVAVHGFVFLSSMKLFLKDTSQINYRKYIKSRFRKIYFPYLIFAVIYYLFEVTRGFYDFNVSQLLKFIFFGSGESHFYFIFVIMQFYLLFPLWRKLLKTNRVITLVAVAAVINFVCYCHLPDILARFGVYNTYNHGIFTSYIFVWILGCVCGKYYDEFAEFIKMHFWKFGIAALVLFLADANMAYKASLYLGHYPISNHVRLLYLYTMIPFMYGLFLVYRPRIFRTELFAKIDDATFPIFLFHVYVIYAVNGFTSSVFKFGQLKMYFINFILVYSISVTLCVMFKNYIRRTKNEKL
ncbi:MAG: acyltransferase [Clostridia bacterium]|nr:acyltransferase [Clostridia bacterium]